jgi:hypothetical protein
MTATARTSRASNAKTSSPAANHNDPSCGCTQVLKIASERMLRTLDELAASLADSMLVPLTNGKSRISSTVGYLSNELYLEDVQLVGRSATECTESLPEA